MTPRHRPPNMDYVYNPFNRETTVWQLGTNIVNIDAKQYSKLLGSKIFPHPTFPRPQGRTKSNDKHKRLLLLRGYAVIPPNSNPTYHPSKDIANI